MAAEQPPNPMPTTPDSIAGPSALELMILELFQALCDLSLCGVQSITCEKCGNQDAGDTAPLGTMEPVILPAVVPGPVRMIIVANGDSASAPKSDGPCMPSHIDHALCAWSAHQYSAMVPFHLLLDRDGRLLQVPLLSD